MECNKRILELQAGDDIEGFYLLNDPVIRTSTNGKPYLAAKLSDSSGSIDLKFWDYSGTIGTEDSGSIVKIRGTVSEYRGTLQLTANRIRLAGGEDVYDESALIPVAPIQAGETIRDIRAMIDSLTDEDLKAVCRWMLREYEQDLLRIPAAKSIHHGFIHGLLMHTHNMMRTADFLAGVYRGVVDRDFLLAGTFLHDIGKIYEFDLTPLGLVKEYSFEGQLLGHLVIGADMVSRACDELGVERGKSVLLQHMLLSHHGTPEHGAAVVPKTAEADLLSYIDLIDSRMEIYRETLEDLRPGEFSDNLFALGKKIYNHGFQEPYPSGEG